MSQRSTTAFERNYNEHCEFDFKGKKALKKQIKSSGLFLLAHGIALNS
jgi:hypothetical protein